MTRYHAAVITEADARGHEHRALQRLCDAVQAQLRAHDAGAVVLYGDIHHRLTAAEEATAIHDAHVQAMARALRDTSCQVQGGAA